MDYGKALRLAVALRPKRQDAIAAHCGVTPCYISLLATGRKNPSKAMMEKLAAALGISLPMFHLLASEASDMANVSQATRNAYGLMLLEFVLNPKGETVE